MAKVYRADSAFDYSLFQGASCAFGVFDGVHLGHRFLLSCAQQTARDEGGLSLALTFDIDPDEVFHADRLKKLMDNETRIATLTQSGVDAVVVLPFTREFASQSPEDFLAATFNGYTPRALHVGCDFHFGSKAAGSVAELERWGAPRNTAICAHDLENSAGKPITATRIRLLLAEGRCEEAVELLGHPYTFKGTVQQGRGEGADMGFATANLLMPAMMRTLGEGVYAAWVSMDGQRYRSAMSVGVSPVFEGATATCEVHILDFGGDIYGKEIIVEPVHFLRPMIKFETVEELISTVNDNIDWVRKNL